jgi:hypothetical protein
VVKRDMEYDVRSIICSYALQERLKAAFPNRPVVADRYVDHDTFYFFSPNRDVRMVRTGSGNIFVCDYARGFPHMRCVRKVKKFVLQLDGNPVD